MNGEACGRCGYRLDEASAFCTNCGASQAVAPPWAAAAGAATPPAAGPDRLAPDLEPGVSAGRALCPGCGVQAPVKGSTCRICDTALPDPRPLSPDVGHELYWVGVQCSFECRVCGHRSPLNHLDVDGSVMCFNCGIEQKFDPDQWWKGIAHAHAVGDLAGPHPEGRFPDDAVSIAKRNEFAPIGVDFTFAEEEQSEVVISGSVTTHSLMVRAMPGHPLCKKCHVPLLLVQANSDGLEIRCSTCREQHVYERPGNLPRQQGALRGVLSDAHRKGQRDVAVERDPGGAILVKCPNCQAPLDVRADQTLVTCTYCEATSRLTAATLRSLGHRVAAPELWWMLFSGASTKRKKLVSLAQKELRKAEEEENRRRKTAEKERQRAQSQASLDGATARVPKPRRRASKQGAVHTVVWALVGGVGIPLLGGFAIYLGEASWAAHGDPASAARGGPASPRAGAANTPVAPVAAPAPVAPAMPMMDLTWNAKVVSATGKALAPGTTCELGARTDMDKIPRTWLQCGSEVLYDSRQAINGMSSWAGEILETRADDVDGWSYFFVFQDVGQRTGRAQLHAGTEAGQILVEDPNPGGFNVALTVNAKSVPRTGEPYVAGGVKFSTIEKALVVEGTTGDAPVTGNSSCQLVLELFAVGENGPACKARLTCGSITLYDTSKPGSFTPCKVGDDGHPQSINDERKSTQDQDPSLLGALGGGTLTVADDPPKGDWSVSLKTQT